MIFKEVSIYSNQAIKADLLRLPGVKLLSIEEHESYDHVTGAVRSTEKLKPKEFLLLKSQRYAAENNNIIAANGEVVHIGLYSAILMGRCLYSVEIGNPLFGKSILQRMGGRRHRLYTAITIRWGDIVRSQIVELTCKMREIPSSELQLFEVTSLVDLYLSPFVNWIRSEDYGMAMGFPHGPITRMLWGLGLKVKSS